MTIDPERIRKIAANPHSPSDLLDKMQDHPDECVRGLVALRRHGWKHEKSVKNEPDSVEQHIFSNAKSEVWLTSEGDWSHHASAELHLRHPWRDRRGRELIARGEPHRAIFADSMGRLTRSRDSTGKELKDHLRDYHIHDD